MVKDPICGMEVNVKKAKEKKLVAKDKQGKTYFFCSNDCKHTFEQKQSGSANFLKISLYSLLIIAILGLLVVLQITSTMLVFMGIFFVIVALLKMIDWKGFANAFAMYDIIAMKNKYYAYVYPLIELALGIGYLFKWQVTVLAIVTLLIMVVGAIGVGRNLLQKNPVKCACLGTMIKIPLTKFTLVEDIVMALMALMILFL